MKIRYHPTYEFGRHVGPAFNWFAWRPVQLWWGQLAWLEWVSCQRVKKRGYLDGPIWEFWSYAHPIAAEKEGKP